MPTRRTMYAPMGWQHQAETYLRGCLPGVPESDTLVEVTDISDRPDFQEGDRVRPQFSFLVGEVSAVVPTGDGWKVFWERDDMVGVIHRESPYNLVKTSRLETVNMRVTGPKEYTKNLHTIIDGLQDRDVLMRVEFTKETDS